MNIGGNNRAVLRVSGEDSASFLQGQLCNDITRATADLGQLSALNSPKGRVLAVFRILKAGDDYLLTMPADLVTDVTVVLRRYVMRAKVSLTYEADQLTARTCQTLPARFAAPGKPFACIQAAGLHIMQLPGPTPLYEVAGAAANVADFVDDIDNDTAVKVVRCGLPDVFAATSGAFVAQMLNLDRLDGISFAKGCYTGQEVIARTQNLGRIKRRMLRYTGSSNIAPVPGDTLQTATDKSVGKVVMAAVGDAGMELLAVVRLDAAEGQALSTDDGVVLQQAALPY